MNIHSCSLHNNNNPQHRYTNHRNSTRSRPRVVSSSRNSRPRSRSRSRSRHRNNTNNNNNNIVSSYHNQAPPAPLLRPQPSPYVLLPLQRSMQSLSQSMNLLEQQIQQQAAAQQAMVQQAMAQIQQQQVQITQNTNYTISTDNRNHTHLHLYRNGHYDHYLIHGPFNLSNGAITVPNEGTVTQIHDGDRHNHNNNHQQSNNNNNNLDCINSIINYLPIRKVRADETNQDIQCRICMESYKENDNMMTLPCFHSFHKDCISIWLRNRMYCPMCRHPINRLSVESDHE